MIGARDRQYLTVLLPIGLVAAVLIDGAFFAAVGGSWFGPPRSCACPAQPIPYVDLGAPNAYPGSGSVIYPVLDASEGLRAGNLSLRYTGSVGQTISAGISGALVNGTTPLALFNFSDNAWVSGRDANVVRGESFVVSSPDFPLLEGGALTVTVISWVPPPIVPA